MRLRFSSKTVLGVSFAFLFNFPAAASSLKIVDYQRQLSPLFRKQIRIKTRFIVIHSTESSLPSALRTLSRGRLWRGSYVTRGGHAHYLIAKNGIVYRILDPKYWANHAGVSMWEGYQDLSDYSIGIELEGYHNLPFSDAQYRSLRKLLEMLQRRYTITDRDVLEHYRVAYSAPNRFHDARMRGRKLDPGFDNFDRLKAGLTDAYSIDPDVTAGRINVSPTLVKAGGYVEPSAEPADEEVEGSVTPAGAEDEGDQITLSRTAWRIAGAQYNSPTTMYYFPDGRSFSGDQIPDWSDIPAGTQVKVGAAKSEPQKVISPLRTEVVAPEISPTQSAWRIAKALYQSALTYYVLPDGRVLQGSELSKVASIPVGTKVLVAYREITKPQTRSAVGEDLEAVYLAPQTVYLLPDLILRSGDQIENFTKLPAAVRVFARVD
jgi:N-acetylmuramoyl-L-alanine amidase